MGWMDRSLDVNDTTADSRASSERSCSYLSPVACESQGGGTTLVCPRVHPSRSGRAYLARRRGDPLRQPYAPWHGVHAPGSLRGTRARSRSAPMSRGATSAQGRKREFVPCHSAVPKSAWQRSGRRGYLLTLRSPRRHGRIWVPHRVTDAMMTTRLAPERKYLSESDFSSIIPCGSLVCFLP